jgi:hypothetical protein
MKNITFREKLEKKLNSMNPKGSGAWFYSEYIKNKVKNVSPGYFDMMLAGTRTMRKDVEKIIRNFLENKGKNDSW